MGPPRPHALGYFSRAGKVTKSAPRGFTPGYPNVLFVFAQFCQSVRPPLLPSVYEAKRLTDNCCTGDIYAAPSRPLGDLRRGVLYVRL